MSNRGRHEQKGNTPNSSYAASSSSDRDQLCLFLKNKSAARRLRAFRCVMNVAITLSDKDKIVLFTLKST